LLLGILPVALLSEINLTRQEPNHRAELSVHLPGLFGNSNLLFIFRQTALLPVFLDDIKAFGLERCHGLLVHGIARIASDDNLRLLVRVGRQAEGLGLVFHGRHHNFARQPRTVIHMDSGAGRFALRLDQKPSAASLLPDTVL